jgi:hypothetical protein
MANPGELSQYIGFTESEVKALCESHGMNSEDVLAWHGGYNLEKTENISCSFSVVRSISHEKCGPYWAQTVAGSSLAGYMTADFEGLKEIIISLLFGQKVKVNTSNFKNDTAGFESIDEVLTVMIHLGYLTLDYETGMAYIPNKDVKKGFEIALHFTEWDGIDRAISKSDELLRATIREDEEPIAMRIGECHMPFTGELKYNDENSLANFIVFLYYEARKDYTMIRELPDGKGFADMVYVPKPGVDKPAMIIELKWDKKVETAIDQIKKNKYIKALEGYAGEVLLVGISYEKEGKAAKRHSCVIEHVAM